MKKAIIVSVLTILAMLPYVQATQQTYTVNTYGYAWSTPTIGVNIQQNPQWAYQIVLDGMNEWNNAQNWFAKTYYPSGTRSDYSFTPSSTGQVTVTFHVDYYNFTYIGYTWTWIDPQSGSWSHMKVDIILPNPNVTYDNVTEYILSIVNHELGHVLGLNEAPPEEASDVMANVGLHTSSISTLDLYAVRVGATGFTGQVTLPSNIPYRYYGDLPVPESVCSQVVLTLSVLFGLSFSLVRSKRRELQITPSRKRNHPKANSLT